MKSSEFDAWIADMLDHAENYHGASEQNTEVNNCYYLSESIVYLEKATCKLNNSVNNSSTGVTNHILIDIDASNCICS